MKRDASVLHRMRRRFALWVRFGWVGNNECHPENTCPSTGSGRTDLGKSTASVRAEPVEAGISLRSNVTNSRRTDLGKSTASVHAEPVEAGISLRSNVTYSGRTDLGKSTASVRAEPVEAGFSLRSNVTYWLPVFAATAVLALSGCDQAATPHGPVYDNAPAKSEMRVYRLAVHPLHNPAKLMQAYQPLADYLSQRLPGVRIEVEASRDYAEYERKFRARAPDLLLPNPWQTLEAMKVGYGVLAMAGDAADFKGIFIVRRFSPLRSVQDLKGKSLAYPSPTALAACIMPQWYLHTQGLDVNRDVENRYVGSQESAIMNVYLEQTAVGVTWPPPWRAFAKEHPTEAAQLKVIWETPPLMNNSVMARSDVPQKLRDQIRALLTTLDQQPEGRSILAGMQTARFHTANDVDYDQVRTFVKRFEAEVRKVEQR
jgi:phosphonate transport system substrate-binding protein